MTQIYLDNTIDNIDKEKYQQLLAIHILLLFMVIYLNYQMEIKTIVYSLI